MIGKITPKDLQIARLEALESFKQIAKDRKTQRMLTLGKDPLKLKIAIVEARPDSRKHKTLIAIRDHIQEQLRDPKFVEVAVMKDARQKASEAFWAKSSPQRRKNTFDRINMWTIRAVLVGSISALVGVASRLTLPGTLGLSIESILMPISLACLITHPAIVIPRIPFDYRLRRQKEACATAKGLDNAIEKARGKAKRLLVAAREHINEKFEKFIAERQPKPARMQAPAPQRERQLVRDHAPEGRQGPAHAQRQGAPVNGAFTPGANAQQRPTNPSVREALGGVQQASASDSVPTTTRPGARAAKYTPQPPQQ